MLLLILTAVALPVVQAQQALPARPFNCPTCYADGQLPAYVHKATAGNSSFDYTVLDNPYTNGQPNEVLMVTSFWNSPQGSAGVWNNHNIGVWYNGSQWTIFNEDGSAIPVGASFSFVAQSPSNSVYVATATAQNVAGDYMTLDNPLINGNPGASVFVTPLYGSTYLYNNHPIGVWYTGSQWAIFNEDGAAMQVGEMFNVSLTFPMGTDCYQQLTTASNTSYDYTTLSDGLTNSGGPKWLTHNWGTSGPYVNHPTGMFVYGSPWGSANAHAAIFNEDAAAMVIGATFNYCVLNE
jgi:hypothetical protein